jgi:hypothetical protein
MRSILLVFFLFAALNTAIVSPLSAQVCPQYLAHHSVGAQAIVPGVYSLRLALQAARADSASTVGLTDFVVRKPLKFLSGVEIDCTIDSRDRVVCGGDNQVYSRGMLLKQAAPALQFPIPAREPDFWVEASSVYAFLGSRGLNYGEYFRRLTGTVQVHGDLAVGQLQTHPEFQEDQDPIHPTILDSGLHAVAAFAMNEKRALESMEVAVPVRFDTVFWNPSFSTESVYRVVVRRYPPNESLQQISYDLALFNAADQIVFGISNGTLQVLPVDTFLR